MKVLSILEAAFRTTTEEQDDTVLWFSQVINKSGGNIEILLCGNAVYYSALKNPMPALDVGFWSQQSPANLHRDISSLCDNSRVYAVWEDIVERGVKQTAINKKVSIVRRIELPALMAAYDLVWNWN